MIKPHTDSFALNVSSLNICVFHTLRQQFKPRKEVGLFLTNLADTEWTCTIVGKNLFSCNFQ